MEANHPILAPSGQFAAHGDSQSPPQPPWQSPRAQTLTCPTDFYRWADQKLGQVFDLANYVATIREGDLWLKLADDWETLCLEYFRRPAQFVDNVVVGVKALREQGHQGPITSEEATRAAVAIARRQTDPASPEFVDPAGAAVKGRGKRLSNTEALSQSEMNSKPGTLRRLARSHPDLLARVESGELSAHAAAVQAGIRKPMKSIPVDTPEAAIRALLRVFTVTDLAQALGKAAEVSPPS